MWQFFVRFESKFIYLFMYNELLHRLCVVNAERHKVMRRIAVTPPSTQANPSWGRWRHLQRHLNHFISLSTHNTMQHKNRTLSFFLLSTYANSVFFSLSLFLWQRKTKLRGWCVLDLHSRVTLSLPLSSLLQSFFLSFPFLSLLLLCLVANTLFLSFLSEPSSFLMLWLLPIDSLSLSLGSLASKFVPFCDLEGSDASLVFWGGCVPCPTFLLFIGYLTNWKNSFCFHCYIIVKLFDVF